MSIKVGNEIHNRSKKKLITVLISDWQHPEQKDEKKIFHNSSDISYL